MSGEDWTGERLGAPTRPVPLGTPVGWLPLLDRGAYDGSRFLRPESVAQAVLLVVTAPPDADVTELSIRPAPR